jgi:SAM-dependent methyltransferase
LASDDDLELGAVDALGFGAVDTQPDPSYLVATMEVTAQWPSVRRLRAWERTRLALGPGDALLDVGCGLGEVVRAYARDVQPGGRAVGIDASTEMLAVARERAAAEGVNATFRTGDALAIDEPDASYDACRAERVLQWVPEPGAAVREMVRVLRPDGRLCLHDTDWRTFTADVPDRELGARFADAIVTYKGVGADTGARLVDLGRRAGLQDLEHTDAVHVWSVWDPDTEAGPPGLFPVADILGVVTRSGALDAREAMRVRAHLEDAARAGRMTLSVRMTAVCARKP